MQINMCMHVYIWVNVQGYKRGSVGIKVMLSEPNYLGSKPCFTTYCPGDCGQVLLQLSNQ